jgi:PIN domain nuclease of toxin-antitoxin system
VPSRRPAGGRLILDTHAWIWSAEGAPERLGPRTLAAIEQAARDATLAVSAISVWELAMLVKRGRLRLASAVGSWIEASLRRPGVRIISVGAAIALDSVQLPDFDRHKDPADRLIVATARRHGTLLTCDRSLLDWAAAHQHVRALDGRA